MENTTESTNTPLVSGDTGARPEIVNKKPGKIVLYPITLHELQSIKRGGAGDVAQNIFYGSLSIFISFFIAYKTCEFKDDYSKLIFLFTSILFAILCIISLITWLVSRSKSNNLYNEIINRDDMR